MEIKILGPGCAKCHQVEKLLQEVVAESGVDTKIIHVTDFKEIAAYGVFTTPSVVVDGKVVSVGKIPRKEEIKGWLK
ncbi:MAG: thioredoxin family protein [Syntrophales bacterium]|nr:thioredoxin family protein [Syntrophales bacterium]